MKKGRKEIINRAILSNLNKIMVVVSIILEGDKRVEKIKMKTIHFQSPNQF